MVAPKAPEGGWRKWFLEHPYQRTKYPILRATKVWAAYEGSPSTPSTAAAYADYEYVEMWYESKSRRVYASLNGQSPDFQWVSPDMEPSWWDDTVNYLFKHVINQKPVTPPEPSGSGWDDLDWSR